MRTLLRIGPNTSRCLSCTPIAARLAHGEKCRVGFVIDSFMVMVLLSSGSVPSIGMTHHRSFRKSFSAGSTLPLLWTKFRSLRKSMREEEKPDGHRLSDDHQTPASHVHAGHGDRRVRWPHRLSALPLSHPSASELHISAGEQR